MDVNVLLTGRLSLDGYGRGKQENADGTYRLTLPEGSTVQEVIQGMRVPPSRVAMTMVNARECEVSAPLKPDDRVILIPSDVALPWRFLGLMNLGPETVFGF